LTPIWYRDKAGKTHQKSSHKRRVLFHLVRGKKKRSSDVIFTPNRYYDFEQGKRNFKCAKKMRGFQSSMGTICASWDMLFSANKKSVQKRCGNERKND
jgi:hypothetical protein